VFVPCRVVTDKLIEFPDSVSESVIAEISKFWTLSEKFKEFGFSQKRGYLLHGPHGCHALGTKVVMFDGSTKKVEDVRTGDQLMGPDGEPRTVLELCFGQSEMFEITPKRSSPFVVNGDHILSLTRSHKKENRHPQIMNVSVKEFFQLSGCTQESFKLYRPERKFVFDNQTPDSEILVDPYILGTWLGDGTQGSPAITSMDPEIVDAWRVDAEKRGLQFTEQLHAKNSRAKVYSMARQKLGINSLTADLRLLGIFDGKDIPDRYLKASVDVRMNLLAGIIDTDGSYSDVKWRPNDKSSIKYKGSYEVIQKNTSIADKVCFLARSLGYKVNIRKTVKTIKSIGFSGEYWRISICGNFEGLPVRLPRKQPRFSKGNKDGMRDGLGVVKSLGIGEYRGFILNKDHLYLTEDFVVHHNSGKSSTLSHIMKRMIAMGGLVMLAEHPNILSACLKKFREVEPTRPVVIIWEDIDSIIKRYGESEVLSVLDGESQISHVVFIATTNFPEDLEKRITNRPSRFDRVELIGMPSAAARRIYLETKLGNTLKEDGISLDKLVKDTDGLSIAHLRELIVNVWCLGNTVDDTIARLRGMNKTPTSASYESDGRVGFGK
jgi:hypothetical protein